MQAKIKCPLSTIQQSSLDGQKISGWGLDLIFDGGSQRLNKDVVMIIELMEAAVYSWYVALNTAVSLHVSLGSRSRAVSFT